jgi:hypothetical protein
MSASAAVGKLEAMMPGKGGLFYARRVGEGWDIIGPVPDAPGPR